MSKVTMPEPVAWVRRHPDGALTAEFLEDAVISPVRKQSGAWLSMVTTTQAEAYADARVAESQQWYPIETAPHETLVVLGWYDENEVFKQEIALASAGRRYPGGASDVWWHGQATHWMPIPVPPLPDPM